MPNLALGKTFIGGVMFLYMLTTSITGLTVDYLNNISTNKVNNEIIKEEIEELINDYKEFEKEFAKQWVNDNPQEEYTKEDLNEIRHESLENYTNNNEYNYVDLSNKTIEFMKNKLTNQEKERIKLYSKINGYQPEELIIYHYLHKIILKETD